MNLRILTPSEIVLDREVLHVSVEDPTGSLGIRPGHADLVTPLVAGVVTARGADGREEYVAVNGGVMVVDGGNVNIVSRQAVSGPNLAQLEETTVAGFEAESRDEKTNRAAFEKMRLRFMRGILEFERADMS